MRMKLLHHELSNLFPRREVSLYKKENSWYKEVSLIDGKFFESDKPNPVPIDIKTLELYCEKFDWIANPIWMKFENNTFKYEMEDFSDSKGFFDCSFIEQLSLLSKLIDIYRDCLIYSKENKTEDIFIHIDMRPHNMFVVDNKLKLIDLDSFRWINKNDCSNWITSTINNILQMVDLKYL